MTEIITGNNQDMDQKDKVIGDIFAFSLLQEAYNLTLAVHQDSSHPECAQIAGQLAQVHIGIIYDRAETPGYNQMYAEYQNAHNNGL